MLENAIYKCLVKLKLQLHKYLNRETIEMPTKSTHENKNKV